MGDLIGIAIGSTFAMLLSGCFAAWIIRKIFRIRYTISVLIGVSAMTFVGAWSITFDGGDSFLQNWLYYLFGGTVAVLIMIMIGANKRREDA